MNTITLYSWDGVKELGVITDPVARKAKRKAFAYIEEQFGKQVAIFETWGSLDDQIWTLTVDTIGRPVDLSKIKKNKTEPAE